jgi:imidazoleglycerol-phosphate dehydratase
VSAPRLSHETPTRPKIQLAINLDGGAFPTTADARLTASVEGHASQATKSQTISINSGVGLLDHMLHALAKHLRGGVQR